MEAVSDPERPGHPFSPRLRSAVHRELEGVRSVGLRVQSFASSSGDLARVTAGAAEDEPFGGPLSAPTSVFAWSFRELSLRQGGRIETLVPG